CCCSSWRTLCCRCGDRKILVPRLGYNCPVSSANFLACCGISGPSKLTDGIRVAHVNVRSLPLCRFGFRLNSLNETASFDTSDIGKRDNRPSLASLDGVENIVCFRF